MKLGLLAQPVFGERVMNGHFISRYRSSMSQSHCKIVYTAHRPATSRGSRWEAALHPSSALAVNTYPTFPDHEILQAAGET